MSILVTISKYLDFGQNFRNYGMWTKFSENPHLRQTFRIISIMAKFSKNLNLCETFEKSGFSSTYYRNGDFGQNL